MKKLKKIFVVLLILICLSVFSFSVNAQTTYSDIPVESYTYWENVGAKGRKPVYTQQTHYVKNVLSSQNLNIPELEGLIDVYADTKQDIYLLDGDNSRLVIVDNKYKVKSDITEIKSEGKNYTFKGARNVYVHSDGKIFISDTENKRVLICNQKGELLDILTVPESNLIPEDFQYLPICVSVDSTGYIYVLCNGSYYGAILYTPEYEFSGFYGANKVKQSVTQALTQMINRLFVNNTKKSLSESVLPYCFIDICIDNENFVYTATGFTEVSQMQGQVKKLNPGKGANIMNSESVNFADDGSNWSYNAGKMLRQDISSIDVDDNGYVYCLDRTYGRIYIYDGQCSLVTAFGGGISEGEQQGVFKGASSLTLCGSDVLVCDSEKKTVTIFGLTDFGKNILTARALTLKGKYEESFDIWQNVIKIDNNCQLAYKGLARAYLAKGEYETAIKYAKQGYDRDTYDIAFGKVRNAFISRNFSWILTFGIILIISLLVLMVISMRKNVRLFKNQKLKLLFDMLVHPFDTFGIIKDKNLGSVTIGAVLIVLFYIVTVMADICGGFSFTYIDFAEYNSLFVLLRSVGIVVLWIVCNKAVTTLMDGKGKTKDIFVVTSYSLLPAIFGKLVYIIFSNILLSTEAEFLSIFQVAMVCYTLLLLLIGTIKIHDYSMGRFLGTSILTLVGMCIVVFLIVMVFMLSQQFVGFLATLFLEMF
ncbi:MAG: hypothetical protein IKK55_00330 [Clostridia bacterium]|nr:hypothetical protein [Clostridia bacterium]